MRPIESLTHQEFKDSLNTSFRVQAEPVGTIEAELAEVSELKTHPGQEFFSIVMRGPNESYLNQGLRKFSHPALGEFEMFIVPIRQDSKGYYYEAIFNRLVPNE